MAQKDSFPELKCYECQFLYRAGNPLFGTRYCSGFPKKKKSKRFRSSDPKYKAPKWCPRRLPSPVCRIYGFADTRSEWMDMLMREQFNPQKERSILPPAYRYKLRLEIPLGMKAKTFFEAVQYGDVDDVLPDARIQMGEVMEIDDGLRPYYFYYFNWSKVIPVFSFDRSRVQK